MSSQPAFPQRNYEGLSKREWFAGMVLSRVPDNVLSSSDDKYIARWCLQKADAILKEVEE